MERSTLRGRIQGSDEIHRRCREGCLFAILFALGGRSPKAGEASRMAFDVCLGSCSAISSAVNAPRECPNMATESGTSDVERFKIWAPIFAEDPVVYSATSWSSIPASGRSVKPNPTAS